MKTKKIVKLLNDDGITVERHEDNPDWYQVSWRSDDWRKHWLRSIWTIPHVMTYTYKGEFVSVYHKSELAEISERVKRINLKANKRYAA